MQPTRGFTLQWHITDRCNLHCTHCYRDEKMQDLPFEQLIRIADTLMEGLTVLKVTPCFALSGGEPFLRQDLFDLVHYLHSKGVTQVLLETNGTLITPHVIERLNEFTPPITTIQVSLDGSIPSVNDPIRGEGAFEKAVSGLISVIAGTPLKTTISYTFHAQNKSDIPSIIALGEKLGVDTLYLTRLVPIGKGKAMDAVLTPEETGEVLAYLHQRNQELSRIGTPHIVENRCLFHLTDPEEAVRRYKNREERLGNACAVASSTFTVLADGTAVPCRRLPIPLGSLLEQSFLDIWFKNDVLWDFRRRQPLLKGKCQSCKYLQYNGLCNGGAACIAYAFSNDYNTPDPQCWYNPEDSR
ncbi:MAG: radical SAM protein [Theionarchaea archaeon]|nr:radical SAM protein [Theionarchaea archaeon]MBU6999588.1 radical SAM protein [Theionarchaea archaeon]MBU7020250.1 radical SAM protein [Theionarchaea archaeon]MBU7035647.1 radical SAM protein [Theionarchaea archaeon]MBU7041207.1 radical SAM protein [Theionarchaea archaeon]